MAYRLPLGHPPGSGCFGIHIGTIARDTHSANVQCTFGITMHAYCEPICMHIGGQYACISGPNMQCILGAFFLQTPKEHCKAHNMQRILGTNMHAYCGPICTHIGSQYARILRSNVQARCAHLCTGCFCNVGVHLKPHWLLNNSWIYIWVLC